MKKFTTILLCAGLFLGVSGVALAKSDVGQKFDGKIEQIREQAEKHVEKIREQSEKKIDKLEDAEDVRRHATSTQAMFIEVGRKGNATMRGFVVSSNPSVISLRTWGGVWTINISSTTAKSGVRKSVPNFAVGDYVLVHGKVSTTSALTIDARRLEDKTP